MAAGRSAEVCCRGAGLTKVPIDGQPKSIVRDLEDMARTYIKVGPAPMHLWLCRSSAGAGSTHTNMPIQMDLKPHLRGLAST